MISSWKSCRQTLRAIETLIACAFIHHYWPGDGDELMPEAEWKPLLSLIRMLLFGGDDCRAKRQAVSVG
jgi:hypothetical protein